MLPLIIEVIKSGDVQRQVIACQSLQGLSQLDSKLWSSSSKDILDILLNAYRFGEAALQSSAAVALFDLFCLEERTAKETEVLAEEAGDVEHTIDYFAAIVAQVQRDRSNKRYGKAQD